MGMALGRDKGGGMDVTYATWTDMLELAERYGWQPTRTGPPRGMKKADWCGSYYTSDGQRFYARDAQALADALDRFLAGEPPVRKPSSKSADPHRAALRGFISGLSQQLGVPLNVPGGNAGADSWMATQEGRDFIREFVAFCRGGSFWMG